MKMIICLFAVLALMCCTREKPSPTTALEPSTRPELRAYLDKADVEAEQVLKEFNLSDLSQRLGGPFVLSDYDTKKSVGQLEGRDVVCVMYRIHRQVGFTGHPHHFEVCVFRDTGETVVFKGR